MATTPAAPLNTFIIYARDDRPYKDQLLRHLRPLVRNGLLRVWHDGDIQPGEDWEERIKTELAASQLVLVLVSVHSLNSDFIENEELAIAVRQLRAGQARIVPILVGPCLWKYHPLLAGLQGLPTDLKPVEEWGNQNSAWLNVVEGLARLSEELQADLAAAEEQRLAEEKRGAKIAQRAAEQARRKPPSANSNPSQTKQRDWQNWVVGGSGVVAALLLLFWLLPKNGMWPSNPQGEQSATTTHLKPAQLADFVLVKGGTFQMGDVMGEKESSDKQVHTITVSDFYLAKHELTFDEYDAFCSATGREKPSDNGWGRGQRPVINVSWLDAVAYCNWRSQQDGRRPAYTIQNEQVELNEGANGYRLPTEAEWEYAAREGGKTVRFGNGRDVIDPSEINFDAGSGNKKPYSIVGEYRQKTVPVHELSANALGLKQMSGNVCEWCWDWYSENFYTVSNGARNPRGPSGGAHRVLRGGGWLNASQSCRAASRFVSTPTYRSSSIGFRLASPLP